MIVIIPAILVAAFMVIKVTSMNFFAGAVVSSFASSEYTSSQQNSDRLKLINAFEPWIAYYNSGTSLLALGAFFEAAKDLEVSLTLTADPLIKCDIQANLAVAYEQYGEELIIDDQFDEAQAYFDRAQEVIDSTDERCRDGETNPDAANSLNNTQDRLDGKEEEEPPPPQEPEPSERQQEELQEEIDQNREDQQEQEDQQRAGGGGLPESEPIDKPW
jgi:tetratricopeptide (TPR) repeat protein